MLFFILVVFVWSLSLAVLRSDCCVSSPVSSGLSLRFVSRVRRVRCSVGVVVRGRSGRRLGGVARSGRLCRVLGRSFVAVRLVAVRV